MHTGLWIAEGEKILPEDAKVGAGHAYGLQEKLDIIASFVIVIHQVLMQSVAARPPHRDILLEALSGSSASHLYASAEASVPRNWQDEGA